MQTSLMASIAGTLATFGVVGSAIWWHDHATSAPRMAHVAALRPLLPTSAPVDKAPHDELERQLARLTGGNLVLDMRSLECRDAAVTQVEHWRNNHPPEAHLVCWLAASDDEELLTAVRSLSRAGCSALRVALVKVTASTD